MTISLVRGAAALDLNIKQLTTFQKKERRLGDLQEAEIEEQKCRKGVEKVRPKL